MASNCLEMPKAVDKIWLELAVAFSQISNRLKVYRFSLFLPNCYLVWKLEIKFLNISFVCLHLAEHDKLLSRNSSITESLLNVPFRDLKLFLSYSFNGLFFTFLGGDEDWRTVLTIPNILREFNQRLIGTSSGKYFASSPCLFSDLQCS